MNPDQDYTTLKANHDKSLVQLDNLIGFLNIYIYIEHKFES